MIYHKNLKGYVSELKEMIKALLNIDSGTYNTISEEEINEFKLHESNFISCSVCSFKVLEAVNLASLISFFFRSFFSRYYPKASFAVAASMEVIKSILKNGFQR